MHRASSCLMRQSMRRALLTDLQAKPVEAGHSDMSPRSSRCLVHMNASTKVGQGHGEGSPPRHVNLRYVGVGVAKHSHSTARCGSIDAQVLRSCEVGRSCLWVWLWLATLTYHSAY